MLYSFLYDLGKSNVAQNALAEGFLMSVLPKFHSIIKKNVTCNNLGFMRVSSDVLYNKDTIFVTLGVTMHILMGTGINALDKSAKKMLH